MPNESKLAFNMKLSQQIKHKSSSSVITAQLQQFPLINISIDIDHLFHFLSLFPEQEFEKQTSPWQQTL